MAHAFVGLFSFLFKLIDVSNFQHNMHFIQNFSIYFLPPFQITRVSALWFSYVLLNSATSLRVYQYLRKNCMYHINTQRSPQNRPSRPRGEVELQLYSFFNLDSRWGWVVNVTTRPLYSRERDSIPFLYEAGWAPEPVWMGAENFASNGIRSLDRPTRSESLYRLSYPGPHIPYTST